MIELNFSKKYRILSKKWFKKVFFFIFFSIFFVFINILLTSFLFIFNFSFYGYKEILIFVLLINVIFIITSIFSCYFLYKQKDIISNRLVIFFTGFITYITIIVSSFIFFNLYFDLKKNYSNNNFETWRKFKLGLNIKNNNEIIYFLVFFIFYFLISFFYGFFAFYLYFQLLKIRKITLIEQWNNKFSLPTYDQLPKESQDVEDHNLNKTKINKNKLKKAKKTIFYKNNNKNELS